ncbi:MAG: glycerol-3-phosphate acyltransferase [Anaerolineales bacterium]|nr:glycerol-3-phosphate acyltransferase [Anaerolineales bacterium]
MAFLLGFLAVVLGYVLGSVPFGLWIVKKIRGRDIRHWYSGRTGGTNVGRVAGFGAGFGTAALDLLKAMGAVWLARYLTGGMIGFEVAAGLAAILGHNYSIFMMQREDGRLRLRGGAGGAASLGAASGLWPPALLIILPLIGIIYFGIGYASVTTMSIAFIAAVIFLIRALLGVGPWAYFVYGVLAECIVVWALRPNIQRLLKGEERLVGWRAKKKLKRSSGGRAEEAV